MTIEEAIAAFRDLSRDEQIRFLVVYANELTIFARLTYEVGTERVLEPTKLRELNEIQHRVTDHARNLLKAAPYRYPDDVLIRAITGEGSAELLWVFARARKQC